MKRISTRGASSPHNNPRGAWRAASDGNLARDAAAAGSPGDGARGDAGSMGIGVSAVITESSQESKLEDSSVRVTTGSRREH